MHTNDTDMLNMRICRILQNTVTNRDDRLRTSRAARDGQTSGLPAAYAPRPPRASIARRLAAPPAHTSATAATPARWLAAASGRCHWSTWPRVSGRPPRPPRARRLDSAVLMGDGRWSRRPQRPRARHFFLWTCAGSACGACVSRCMRGQRPGGGTGAERAGPQRKMHAAGSGGLRGFKAHIPY